MNNDYDCKPKSRHYTYQKRHIVPLTHTVIEPHAVVVEFVYTSIAGAAVLAVCHAVAITELTVENFVILWCEVYLLVMA